MQAGYESGFYFIKILKEESGCGLSSMYYTIKHFDKPTGTIIMTKKRRTLFKRKHQPPPKKDGQGKL